MTRVVIVGEIYEQNVQVGGGPMPGGGWGGPVDPGWGHTPGHPANRPPGSSPGYPTGGPVYPGGPTDPGYGRPGWSPVDPGWGHTPGHPGNRPPGSWTGERPDNSLPEPPAGGTDVPEDVYTPAPVPEEIASQVVVTVYDPRTQTYTTKSYPPR